MRVTLISWVLAMVFVTSATAQSPALLDRFERFDRNRDGKLTPEELSRPDWFRRFDRNRDGVIDRSEVGGGPARSRTPGTGAGDLAVPEEPPHRKHLGIRYAEIAGVDTDLLSLDLYVPAEAQASSRQPVMIMIHGGGWRGGDKGNPPIVGAKLRHFVGQGYVYVAVNYRLSPRTPEPGGLKHPIHAVDCAAAIAWLHDHVAMYGGDPERLHLIGHSAGGHLAAIVATNERFLAAHGKDLSIIRSIVLLDPAALDIPRYLELAKGREMTDLYALAFGADDDNRRDASPQHHVAPGKKMPRTLIFYAGDRMHMDVLAPAFAEALAEAGSPSRAVDTVTLDHGEINSRIGMIDEPMTTLVMRLHAGEDPTTFPERLGRETIAPPDPAAHQIAFTRDYQAGTRDVHGRFMGGTETMRIAAHGGRLFAALGYWTDQPGSDPQPGAQIVVKRGPDASWELDRDFPGALRVNCMEPITFTTDGAGKPLASSVQLLLADAGLIEARNHGGALSVWVRDDETHTWVESRVTDRAERAYIRAIGQQRDTVTGVDHVFAGTGAGEIYSGVHDPGAPGRIRWNLKPEYVNPDFDGSAFHRCQGFCVANRKAYASISPSLVVRRDGPDLGGEHGKRARMLRALRGGHLRALPEGWKDPGHRLPRRIDPLLEYSVGRGVLPYSVRDSGRVRLADKKESARNLRREHGAVAHERA